MNTLFVAKRLINRKSRDEENVAKPEQQIQYIKDMDIIAIVHVLSKQKSFAS
jgi:hypothetical protein